MSIDKVLLEDSTLRNLHIDFMAIAMLNWHTQTLFLMSTHTTKPTWPLQ